MDTNTTNTEIWQAYVDLKPNFKRYSERLEKLSKEFGMDIIVISNLLEYQEIKLNIEPPKPKQLYPERVD